MFQDEKTTELDLNSAHTSLDSTSKNARWTEHPRTPNSPDHVRPRHSSAVGHSVALDHKQGTWLIKLAAAVSILLLSLWLF
ncbi:hypothetical protein EBQ90_01170 [bacterium]|nr:hypothetical protein [bacterium]